MCTIFFIITMIPNLKILENCFFLIDPRTENLLLVKEPLYIIGLIVAYLFIVIKGPQWMAKREGFELRKALIVYNFFLVALSGWMTYEVRNSMTIKHKLYLVNWMLLCIG